MNDTAIRELVSKHNKVKKAAAKAKALEMKLRLLIISELFPSAKRGTNKAALKSIGLDIKAVIKESWSVVQDGMDELLCEHEDIQPAFKYVYDLKLKEYKELTDEQKILLAKNVTCKDASPELSYEGELPQVCILEGLTTRDGALLFEGVVLTFEESVKMVSYYGFQTVEELVKFLEMIQ